MSNNNHFKANLRDLEFNLFEYLNIQEKVLGKGEFTAMDEETARASLEGIKTFAETEFGTSYAEGDQVPLKLAENGDVTLSPLTYKALKAWYGAEWHRFELPEHLGGYGAPPSLAWAGWDMIVGANPSAALYLLGTFVSRVIDRLGTEKQKERFVTNIIDRHWGATMMLTEPNAGSDVGAGRSKAKHIKDDVWELEGVKRFITNGDYNSTENIIHMVLARPEGAEPGTKGLSLFIVPKFWVDEEGEMGERNGIKVTAIEHKMGIRASATCEITMGDGDIPCRGLLVGEVHQGIKQMFMVIEQARMSIGSKSASQTSTAYLHALEFAKERVQSADLTQIMNKTAPRVEIIKHPDVRRMLMDLKSHSEGMRALTLFTASVQDQVILAGGHATEEGKKIDRLNDLLLPLVKGYCSERAYGLLADALQIFGGSGYCTDYPIEQYIRDQKIDSLYEGTTAIQALDLFFRKVGRDQGETLRVLFGKIQASIDNEIGGDALTAERKALKRGLDDVGSIFMTMIGKMQESLYYVGLHGNKILFSLAELTIGWLLVEHAAVALEKKEAAHTADKNYYEGKIASAKWFTQSVLPKLTLNRKMIENLPLDIMNFPEEIF